MPESQQRTENDVLTLPDFSDNDTEFLDAQAVAARKRGRRRWIVVLAIVLLVVVLGAIILVALRGGRSRVAYQTQPASQGNLSLAVTATGPVQGTIYGVSFPTTGKISQINVKVGQHVHAGDVLARLDPTSLQDAVNQAQATVNADQTSLNDAENNQSRVTSQSSAQIAVARDQEKQALNNCDNPPKGTTAPPHCEDLARNQYTQSVRQAATQNTSAQSQVNSAQSQLNTAQTQLNTAQHNMNNATLTAPHDGVVAAVNGTVGGNPGAGSSGNSGSSGGGTTSAASAGSFIQIVDLSALQVSTNVNEADIGSVSIGQKAQFTVSAYGSQAFNGTVSAVSPLGQSASNVVTYSVLMDVDMSTLHGASLLPGMTANVTIMTTQRLDVLLIPVEAVNFARTTAAQTTSSGANVISPAQIADALARARQMSLDLQASKPDLIKDQPTPAYVLERAQNQWIVKPVVLGLTDGTSYEVLAGLNTGELIVVGTQSSTPAVPGGGGGGGAPGGFIRPGSAPSA
ncbi:MAG: efflux RND transporter periplasmic adaptor subunit [Chloroflexota bacterium]|nr:efflux RND transporter periplasmic adaptor subunit [Chloroflexota bacterium]